MKHANDTIYSAASIIGEDGSPYDLFLRLDSDESYRWYMHIPATDSAPEGEHDTEVSGKSVAHAKEAARLAWRAESWELGIKP